MLKMSSRRLLGLILITYFLLGDHHQVNGLRCHQCIQGPNYFCSEDDMYSLNCPDDAVKCGVSYATLNSYQYEWRGCVSSTADSAITTDLSSFGDQILGWKLNATSYETCAEDLCNAPLKCYFCTAGESFICDKNDTGVINCHLTQSYCGKVTFTDGKVWKGCLTSDQVSGYTNIGNKADILNNLITDFKLSNSTASTANGFYSCNTDRCNSGHLSVPLSLFNMALPILFTLALLFVSF